MENVIYTSIRLCAGKLGFTFTRPHQAACGEAGIHSQRLQYILLLPEKSHLEITSQTVAYTMAADSTTFQPT